MLSAVRIWYADSLLLRLAPDADSVRQDSYVGVAVDVLDLTITVKGRYFYVHSLPQKGSRERGRNKTSELMSTAQS
jgi:hypothetical protein